MTSPKPSILDQVSDDLKTLYAFRNFLKKEDLPYFDELAPRIRNIFVGVVIQELPIPFDYILFNIILEQHKLITHLNLEIAQQTKQNQKH
jgi:hypothetical protein